MSPLPYLFTILLAFASPTFSSPLSRRASPVISNCKHDIAVTYDDGPFTWQEEIVDEFACAGSKTTFFVNGNHESCIYSPENVERLRYAFEANNLIASHTWSNADLSTLSEAQIDVEIQRLDEALIKILGVKPKIFRAPNNNLPDSAANYIATKYGKTIVSSDVDSGDTNAGATVDSVLQFYKGLADQGTGHPHMTRAHETESVTLDAINLGSVAVLIEAGIKLVTVAECLDILPYELIGTYGVRDSSWTCDGSWSPPATPTCTQTYTATATDKTCTAIAAKFGLTPQAIYFSNPFLNCQDVYQWTPICIPAAPVITPIACAQKYTTSAGETCKTIASKFGVTTENLFNANSFVNCLSIWAGTPLCIPKSESTTSTTSAAPPTGTCAYTYYSAAGETCQIIEQKLGLMEGTIKAYTSYVDCGSIWVGTPLCIPSGGTGSTSTTSTTSTASPAPTCAYTYRSVAGETCQIIEQKLGLPSGAILLNNGFVSCNSLWANTPWGDWSSSSTSTTSSAAPAPTCLSTYRSVARDTCDSIGARFSLTATQIKNANSFLDCQSVWENTPICLPPTGGASCTQTISSTSGATCESLGLQYNVSGAQIKAWNIFLSCDNVWNNTPVCVRH